jgi:single-stranded-DNA-specific exonuclease
MEKWFITMKKADFEGISKKYKISPILARLIRNRDRITDEEIASYLYGSVEMLYDGAKMKGMKETVAILREKIASGAKIRVIGDYDIDGVNATYILQKGIEFAGGNVDTDIPDRMKDGYGLNQTLIERALEAGVDTLITCDNGIAAYDEIAYAKEKGLTVLVTDHHEVPYQMEGEEKVYRIPPADAVVNPHQVDCPYPFSGLCGAAVAYKVVEQLAIASGKNPRELDFLIESVAIATIGDVMDLVDENRIFVKEGLRRLKKTENLGLKALMDATGVESEQLQAYHIGFVLGPCINAGGRLDTAKRALNLLNASTRREAVMLAEDLKELNDQRKELTEQGIAAAIEQIETGNMLENRVLVVYLPEVHESIAGIIAGRIKERYERPTFILTDAENGAKGSGRSIEAYSMYEEMTKCKELFTKYGGHKLAAGLSLPTENIDVFRKEINEKCTLTSDDLIPKVTIDLRLPIEHVTEDLVEELHQLEPFGKGNSKPMFAEKDLQVFNPRILGRNKNVLAFQVKDEKGTACDAIYFGDVENCLKAIEEKGELSVIFYPTINEFRGQRKLQLQISNYK